MSFGIKGRGFVSCSNISLVSCKIIESWDEWKEPRKRLEALSEDASRPNVSARYPELKGVCCAWLYCR